jgi:glutamine amidotransferase
MCELFGFSSDQPVHAAELLCRFGARGGDTADNPDGWGLAMLEGDAFRLAKEPLPAAWSPRFRELCRQTRSSLILGHVRKANPPTARVLANTHPFLRVCCGREWVFAHNGIIPDSNALAAKEAASLCTVSGDTDSEHAFCMVLNRIAAAFSATGATPARDWLEALAGVAEMLASLGRFNFLMSDGVHLIAYGHDRLHGLTSAGLAIIATEPLTADPGWAAFAPGELSVYRRGKRIARFLTHPHPVITTASADSAQQPIMRT